MNAGHVGEGVVLSIEAVFPFLPSSPSLRKPQ